MDETRTANVVEGKKEGYFVLTRNSKTRVMASVPVLDIEGGTAVSIATVQKSGNTPIEITSYQGGFFVVASVRIFLPTSIFEAIVFVGWVTDSTFSSGLVIRLVSQI